MNRGEGGLRILFVHSGVDLYGASRSLLRLASRLVRDGHAVLAVLPGDGPLRVELESNRVEVLVHRRMPVVTRARMRSLRGVLSLLFNIPVSILWLWRVSFRFRADLMHTNTAVILSPGFVARLRGIPHVWHVREFFAEFGKLWGAYQWAMHALADVIVCVSTPVARQFAPRILRKKTLVLHNGFPREEFGEVDEARIGAFRTRFGLGSSRLVGVVGRIKAGRKGQDSFVRAVARLKGRFPDVRYVLIGSPFPGNEDHLERVQALIGELGLTREVVCTGDVADIKAAYASLTISVLPSGLPEPFGGVVIESMAMGKPVVGTRHGGTIEQVDDGMTGLLVPPGDPAALASALAQLLGDPDQARRMGEAGRERFLRLFEFEPFYRKMTDLYARLRSGLGKSPPAGARFIPRV